MASKLYCLAGKVTRMKPVNTNKASKRGEDRGGAGSVWWASQNRFRRAGQTFERFMQCLKWAEEGKTFIYWHPKFVAIDMKQWEQIQKKLNPPIKKSLMFYDEYEDLTPEREKELQKYFNERLKEKI